MVIHGIGEQRPMKTVRSFVESVWLQDGSLEVCAADGEKSIWLGPDARLASNELVRITTNRLCVRDADGTRSRKGPRTDFFELYWQHLMGANRWSHIFGWMIPLLMRPRQRVPPALHTAWWTAWGLLGVLGVCVADFFIAQNLGRGPFEVVFGQTLGLFLRGSFAFSSSILGWVGAQTVLRYVGDAARYLDDAPGNVEVRQAIRGEGLRLLRALRDSGEYDRIVIVGHSLGAVIGYDLVRFLWAETDSPPLPRRDAGHPLARVEAAAEALHVRPGPQTRAAFLAAQSAYANHLRRCERGDPPCSAWPITDLVTLGAPLTHADVLLAESREDFERLVAERGLPTCPPVMETVDGERRFTYRRRATDGEEGRWQAHHAAPFGAVRWTNLYFPYDGRLRGDLVGGPVAPLFGPGVVDVPVRSSRVGGLSCHTHYWTADANIGEHIVELRRALDLGQQRLNDALP